MSGREAFPEAAGNHLPHYLMTSHSRANLAERCLAMECSSITARYQLNSGEASDSVKDFFSVLFAYPAVEPTGYALTGISHVSSILNRFS